MAGVKTVPLAGATGVVVVKVAVMALFPQCFLKPHYA
jgi:hypothetical protein